MVENVPEEDKPKREAMRKGRQRAKSMDVRLSYEKLPVSDENIKVGKLDTTHLEEKIEKSHVIPETIKPSNEKIETVTKVTILLFGFHTTKINILKLSRSINVLNKKD